MPQYVSVVFDIPVNQAWTYSQPDACDAKLGARVEAVFRKRKRTGWVVAACEDSSELDPERIRPYERLIDDEPLITEELLSLAEWMASMYFCSVGEALAIMSPSAKRERESSASSMPETDMALRALALSDEQKTALSSVTSSPEGRWYVYGPTGSGKTEVFLEAAEKTLAEGRGVIYLVPEIALTRQVVEAVQARFGSLCAVIHSGLSAGNKLSEWRRIQRGEARVVVGARSAVFAPVHKLGLIVLDEEHETSYKASSTPRYHARQVAIHRAAKQKARLLMGSATPSLEIWHILNAAQKAEQPWAKKLTLSKRLSGGEMPRIELVDMRCETGVFSKRLIQSIREVKAQGGQSILFLNRRGFSYFWNCKTCGAEMKCRQCSVGLTYHKQSSKLVCHYCGYQTAPPSACPSCGSLDTGWAGFGTERVEEEAAALFPDMSMARLDTDAVTRKGTLEKTLDIFRRGNIDILLGTQMVAKGLNFPGVKLVGIMLADTGLNMPDFRAAERTFGLVTQVAGRAGRFTKGGKVILQTYRPTSPVFVCAAAHDIESFYADELAARKSLGFPPFSRLLRIVIRSKDGAAARRGADELASHLRNARVDGMELLGPAECPIAVLAGNTRFHILIQSHAAAILKSALRKALSGWNCPASVYIEIDSDPVSLL